MAREAGFTIKHWDDDEVALLVRLKREGVSWPEIAAQVGRSTQACQRKWEWVNDDPIE